MIRIRFYRSASPDIYYWDWGVELIKGFDYTHLSKRVVTQTAFKKTLHLTTPVIHWIYIPFTNTRKL